MRMYDLRDEGEATGATAVAYKLSENLKSRSNQLKLVGNHLQKLCMSDDYNMLVLANERMGIGEEVTRNALKQAEAERLRSSQIEKHGHSFGVSTNYDNYDMIGRLAESGDWLCQRICRDLDRVFGDYSFDKRKAVNPIRMQVATKLINRTMTKSEYIGLMTGKIPYAINHKTRLHDPMFLGRNGKSDNRVSE